MIEQRPTSHVDRGVAGAAAPGTARAVLGCSDGFTLAELLVTIVVTGLIGAGVLSLLMEQNEFYGMNEDKSFADVSRRGVAELVSSELRMLSTADLYKTKGDSIRARFDLMQGVVCDVTGSSVTLVVYHAPDPALTSGRTGTAYSSPFAADFVYGDGWTPTFVADGSTPKSTCVNGSSVLDGGAPSGLDPARYRIEDWSGHPFASLPPEGSVVRIYGDLVYTFKASDRGDGLALWRNETELVAPFAEGAGFTYIMNNGNQENSVPNSNHKDISRIRVTAEAMGDGVNRYDVAQDLEIDLSFRN